MKVINSDNIVFNLDGGKLVNSKEWQYDPTYLKILTKEKLLQKELKIYNENNYNKQYYNSIDTTLTEENDEFLFSYILEEKYSLIDLKKMVFSKIKGELKELYAVAKKRVLWLSEFDPLSQELIDLNTYISNLKTAYINIKSDIKGLSIYSDVIAYWEKTVSKIHYKDRLPVEVSSS